VTLAFFPAGFISNWFIDNFCDTDKSIAENENKSIFEILKKKSEFISEPTGILITPHLVGSCNPHWDVNATGSILGLTTASSKYHIYKAIFEGLACELAENIAVLEEITGKIEHIRIFGGNARSEFSLKLRADISNRSFQLLGHSDAVCQGAAILAGMAVGIYANAKDAVNQTLQSKNTIIPDKQKHLEYKSQSEKYKMIYSSIERIRKI
jgi:xylulokinase